MILGIEVCSGSWPLTEKELIIENILIYSGNIVKIY